MSDAGDLENTVQVARIKIAVGLAKGAVGLQIIGGNPAFDHDVRARRHLEIDGLAPDHLQRAAREPAGESDFIHAVRHRLHRGVSDTGRAADDDGGIERNTPLVALLPVHRRVFEAPPHDAGFERAFDLPAINPHVSDARLGVFGNPATGREIRSVVEARCRNRNRQHIEAAAANQFLALIDDFLDFA